MKHYSIPIKKLSIDYLEKGHTFDEACEAFGMSRVSLNNWKKQWKTEGHLENKKQYVGFKKN